MTKWILTHSDGDGICAGALALAANPDAQVFFTHPYGLLEDLGNIAAGDTVIICDIALLEDKLPEILNKFLEISSSGELFYIDHHPLPEGISVKDISGRVIHNINSSASELTYMLFHDKLSHLMGRVAIYGAIADYLDDTPLINRMLCSWDKRTIYFDTGVLVQGLEGRKRDHEFKRRVVAHLASGQLPSQHTNLLNSALDNTRREEEIIRMLDKWIHVYGDIAYTIDVPFSLGKTATYARALTKALVGVAGERRKGFIDMSLRTCEKSIDLNKILRHIAPNLGGSGGGHPQAAGARIPEENFNRFIQEVNESIRRRSE
ncbi:MAG: DHH family phosphoesterase [Candidatus Bathyarchaeia archaeon]